VEHVPLIAVSLMGMTPFDLEEILQRFSETFWLHL
jgi:hypothetical protein